MLKSCLCLLHQQELHNYRLFLRVNNSPVHLEAVHQSRCSVQSNQVNMNHRLIINLLGDDGSVRLQHLFSGHTLGLCNRTLPHVLDIINNEFETSSSGTQYKVYLLPHYLDHHTPVVQVVNQLSKQYKF